MMFSYKVHSIGDETILAVADSELVRKTLKEGGKKVFISPDFYEEKFSNAEGILALASRAKHINALGDKIVEVLVKGKIADKNSVIQICGVSHAQVYSVE